MARNLATPVANLLSRTPVTPNTLTVTGFLISVGAAVAIAKGFLLVGGLVVLFAGVFDLLDGPLARSKGQASRFGAILDSTLDRLSEAAVLLGVLLYFLLSDGSTWGPPLAYAALAASFMVSYLRARAEGLGIACEVGLFTRTERVVVLSVSLIVGQWIDMAVLVALGLLTALCLFTLFQRLFYARQVMKKDP
jgi:CDP-diacylglycerol---glycerol-3-phosphate 3-phosphatidyltransferase